MILFLVLVGCVCAWKCGVRYGKWSQEDRVSVSGEPLAVIGAEALMVTVMSFAPLLTAQLSETMDELNKSKNKDSKGH